MADVQSIADSIRDVGGNMDTDDPQQIHDTLVSMHDIVRAVQETLQQMADQLPETGVKDRYAEAVAEAASGLNGIADQLQQEVGGGVTSARG